jgi:wyosine [tRNA(Phe)-imidazoG37] synthetase (radical SAM superfamily)
MVNEEKIKADLILIVSEEMYQDKLPNIIQGIQIINKEYDITCDIETMVVGNAKYVPSGLKISEKIKELKNKDYEITLDITPGRKSLVAAALISAEKMQISHVLYLAADDIRDIPLMMKPKKLLHFRDFLSEVQRGIQ